MTKSGPMMMLSLLGMLLLLLMTASVTRTSALADELLFVPNCSEGQSRINVTPWGGMATTDDANNRQNYNQIGRYGDMPSLPSCETAGDNVRGTYSSRVAPCEFTFHSIKQKSSTNKKKGNNNPDGSSFGHLPTVCTDDNKIELSDTKDSVVLQYVHGWKDECVGNFPRCYSLLNHQKIYLDLICRKKWPIPDGTTHIRVNCTKDMKLTAEKVAQIKNESVFVDPLAKVHDKALDLSNKRWSEMRSFVTFLITALVLLCIGFSFFSYVCVVKPYLNNLSKQTSSEMKDLIQRDGLEEVVWQGDGKVRRRAAAPGSNEP